MTQTQSSWGETYCEFNPVSQRLVVKIKNTLPRSRLEEIVTRYNGAVTAQITLKRTEHARLYVLQFPERSYELARLALYELPEVLEMNELMHEKKYVTEDSEN